jgi:hypothetical protein
MKAQRNAANVILPGAAAGGRISAAATCWARGSQGSLEILGNQSGSLRQPRKHAGADFVRVVEGEHDIRPTRSS